MTHRILSINIGLENDAFKPDERPEIGRILKEIAFLIEEGESINKRIMDVNGNTVGYFTILTMKAPIPLIDE